MRSVASRRATPVAAGFWQGMFGDVPEWFARRGHDNDAMAAWYFDRLRHSAAVRSVDDVESDLSGFVEPA